MLLVARQALTNPQYTVAGLVFGDSVRFWVEISTACLLFLILPTSRARTGRPLIGRRGSVGGAPEKRSVLEVKLMCHPLVTMAPDIR